MKKFSAVEKIYKEDSEVNLSKVFQNAPCEVQAVSQPPANIEPAKLCESQKRHRGVKKMHSVKMKLGDLLEHPADLIGYIPGSGNFVRCYSVDQHIVARVYEKYNLTEIPLTLELQ